MKFMALLYTDVAKLPRDEAGYAKLTKAYDEFTQSVKNAGTYVDGMPLSPLPDEVRTVKGSGIRNGPPAARVEALVGYYILDYPSPDAAAKAAKEIPAAKTGTVEVIPFGQM